jgi:cytidine deaminase
MLQPTEESMSLIEAAREVRENAWAPYSRFKVGAAIRAESGRVHVGCNVENVAYPEGTCAEAGSPISPTAVSSASIWRRPALTTA